MKASLLRFSESSIADKVRILKRQLREKETIKKYETLLYELAQSEYPLDADKRYYELKKFSDKHHLPISPVEKVYKSGKEESWSRSADRIAVGQINEFGAILGYLDIFHIDPYNYSEYNLKEITLKYIGQNPNKKEAAILRDKILPSLEKGVWKEFDRLLGQGKVLSRVDYDAMNRIVPELKKYGIISVEQMRKMIGAEIDEINDARHHNRYGLP